MKRPALARDLVPVKEFRSHLADWLKQVDETGRPVVVTQRGRAAAVLMHPAALDELDEQKELVQKVLRGLAEVQAGQFTDEDELWAEVEQVILAAEEGRADRMDQGRPR